MASTRAPYQLVGSYDVQRDDYIDGQRTQNMYVMPAPSAVSKEVLVPASGFENGISIGSGAIRAQFVFKDKMYVVSGDEVYEVDSGLVPTFIATINTSFGYVGITANENQVIFVDGIDGYIWNTMTATFSVIAFGFPIVPADVTMLDNYFIIPDAGTIKWYISALNDGLTWNVLDFANFLSTPDQLVAVQTLKRRLYLFGSLSAGDSVEGQRILR